MKARELLAPALLAAHAAFGPRAVPGEFRALLLHDVPPAQYRRLARLLDHAAQSGGFVSPQEAASRLEHRSAGTGRFLLTFDDGFMGNRDVAERVLAPRGIKAAFFVNPGLIEGQPDRTYMGWDDLMALAQEGHVIGSHGWSHTRLAGLRGADLEAEIARPGETLAARLGTPPEWFAYPFGDIDSIDAESLALIGRRYRICRSGVRGPNAPGAHRLAVLADHVDLGASFAWQRLTLAGGLDGRYGPARARLLGMARSAASS